MADTKIKIRPFTSMETAIRLYYTYPELKNEHIRELFGIAASSSISRYKKPVLEEQAKRGILTMQSYAVNTNVAYEVWGINVKDLERRRDKLQKLGFTGIGV